MFPSWIAWTTSGLRSKVTIFAWLPESSLAWTTAVAMPASRVTMWVIDGVLRQLGADRLLRPTAGPIR